MIEWLCMMSNSGKQISEIPAQAYVFCLQETDFLYAFHSIYFLCISMVENLLDKGEGQKFQHHRQTKSAAVSFISVKQTVGFQCINSHSIMPLAFEIHPKGLYWCN